ncbi:aldehyde dehydrogenase family protein [Janthinobacterium sp. HLX7-2]|uniref:aldehyde dehydrogenase family protein n=1 Tax=Janthinobacterium sp. HLX7-2 TaxID=1259331 RepID=UPI003F51E276
MRNTDSAVYCATVSPHGATRAAAQLDDVDQAIAAAQQAFPAWAAMLPGARRALLQKAADVMESHRAEFVARGVAEAGGGPVWYWRAPALTSEAFDADGYYCTGDAHRPARADRQRLR